MEEAFMQRTVTCGELRAKDEGKSVILNGWVARNRDHGALHFINLRDRYGVTQVVVDDDASEGIHQRLDEHARDDGERQAKQHAAKSYNGKRRPCLYDKPPLGIVNLVGA